MATLKTNFTKPNILSAQVRGDVIVAALDMGSNSFHLVVVRGHGRNNFEVLLKEKVMMRLGDEVANTQKFSSKTSETIKEVVATMASLATGVGASEMVALATAAFRDAKNAGALVDEIEETLGIKVSVISGKTEATLIWEAISHAVDFGGQCVVGADLGGGSMEITAGNQDELGEADSYPVGVGRLTAKYKNAKSPSGIDADSLEKYLISILELPLSNIRKRYQPDSLVLSSGSFLNIARMALLLDGNKEWGDASINQATIPVASLLSICRDLVRLDPKSRAKLPGIDEKRIDLLPSAAVVLKCLIDILEPRAVVSCEWALREGIILRELSRRNEEEFDGDRHSIKQSGVIAIASRYGWNEGHAKQVAAIALALFDQTKTLHGLDNRDRELLYLAALVHDIGEYISVEGHDRHGAYLLENSRLPGFDMDEKNQLVSVVRFHRRGSPKADYPPYAALPKATATKVVKMAAILRLADALDRSHTRLVTGVEVSVNASQVLIFVGSDSQVELEEYGLRRKRQLFEETFGRAVHLVQDGRQIARLNAD